MLPGRHPLEAPQFHVWGRVVEDREDRDHDGDDDRPFRDLPDGHRGARQPERLATASTSGPVTTRDKADRREDTITSVTSIWSGRSRQIGRPSGVS